MSTRTTRRTSSRIKAQTLGDPNESDINNSASASRERTPERSSRSASRQHTPLRVPLPGLAPLTGDRGEPLGLGTPLKTRGLNILRQKIEEELGKSPVSVKSTTSPGLARLRSTPGLGLKERQRELIEKHEQIRQHSDKLSLGGGVTLWPNMHQMRLSRKEIVTLAIVCLGLMVLTGWLFVFLHGETITNMQSLTVKLQDFSGDHEIQLMGSPKALKASLLAWHTDFRQLLDGADKMLNVRRPSVGYQLYIAAYLTGFGVLVYFLVDNMLSRSKLSPGRIKKWVCLLVVIGQWTVMLFFMFIYAQRVETAVVNNVIQLSERLGDLVGTDVELSTLSVMLQYWRGRCLPPTAQGVVWVLGLVPVHEVSIYLQYYSLPVVTVLFTPVVRLCLALKSVYSLPK